MGSTTAEMVFEDFKDFGSSWFRLLLEKGENFQNQATGAKTTLKGLMFQKGLLKGMKFLAIAQTFKREHMPAINSTDFCLTGADRFAI
jgi:hypothetical protein